MDQLRFNNDPMMQQFLADLDAFQRQQLLGGNKAKQPMPSNYSGGDDRSEKLMRDLLERILGNQFAGPRRPVPQNADPVPNYGAETVGDRWK